MDKIRKEIHLPSEIGNDLKVVAAYADKSVKRYMEDIILNDVEIQMVKINRNKSFLGNLKASIKL